jgi:hypothetical protein
MSDQTVEVSARVHPGVSWMQDVLPFVTSLMAHAFIVAFGILSYKAYQLAKAPTSVEQIIIPDSTIVDNQPPGGVPNVNLRDDLLKQARQDTTPEGDKFWANKKSPQVQVDVSYAGGGSGESNDAIITVGPGGGFGHGTAMGPGTGNVAGTSDGDGSGPLAPFGIVSSSQVFIPPRGNARTIIFVCDCTGSMINKIAQLKVELSRAVQNLKPIQSFNIVFYQDESVLKLSSSMIQANPENKRKAEAWLGDIIPAGTTDPVPALSFALASKPDLIYFLTDAADFPDLPAVQMVFHKLNWEHRIKVNTILFVETREEKEANKESEPLMAGISKENGGNFRWVTMDDLH